MAVLFKLNTAGRGGVDGNIMPQAVVVLMHMTGDHGLYLTMRQEHGIKLLLIVDPLAIKPRGVDRDRGVMHGN